MFGILCGESRMALRRTVEVAPTFLVGMTPFASGVLQRFVRLRDVLEVLFLDCEDRVVSVASERCLFTVAAAISFARLLLLPRFCADSLMCSY